MKLGTKSILFGYHAFYIHPFFVAAAWWKLYGFPFDPRLWVAFFVHDLGYWGKPNMDGEEGESHPEWGAEFMKTLFCEGFCCGGSGCWYEFCLYHSRSYARRDDAPVSKLCIADKLAYCLYPEWLCLLLTKITGEIHEYLTLDKQTNSKVWFRAYRHKLLNWIESELNNAATANTTN